MTGFKLWKATAVPTAPQQLPINDLMLPDYDLFICVNES